MTNKIVNKIKENRLNFTDRSENLESVDGVKIPVSVINLRRELAPYILGGIIGKVDSYALNSARIIYIKFNVEMSELRLKKICKIVFGCIPTETIKLTYKGVNGAEYVFMNPLEVAKIESALAMLDTLEDTI